MIDFIRTFIAVVLVLLGTALVIGVVSMARPDLSFHHKFVDNK